jgi:hypothetical protein
MPNIPATISRAYWSNKAIFLFTPEYLLIFIVKSLFFSKLFPVYYHIFFLIFWIEEIFKIEFQKNSQIQIDEKEKTIEQIFSEHNEKDKLESVENWLRIIPRRKLPFLIYS